MFVNVFLSPVLLKLYIFIKNGFSMKHILILFTLFILSFQLHNRFLFVCGMIYLTISTGILIAKLSNEEQSYE